VTTLAHPLALLHSISESFGRARRFEQLFSLSEAQLAARGMDRDALVRTYIAGLAHN